MNFPAILLVMIGFIAGAAFVITSQAAFEHHINRVTINGK